MGALSVVLGAATELPAQPVDVAPDGIVFREPFVDVDGHVTNGAVTRPDSIVFRTPFIDVEGNVTLGQVAPPSRLAYLEPFVDADGSVTRSELSAPGGLEFRQPFVDIDGHVFNPDLEPPSGLVFRDVFLYPDGAVRAAAAPPPGAEVPLLRISGAAPNPFNSGTQVSFLLREPRNVTVDVFDLRGGLVRRLHQGPLAADLHVMRWDGTDRAGRAAPSGTYVFRVRAGDQALEVKAVLMK